MTSLCVSSKVRLYADNVILYTQASSLKRTAINYNWFLTQWSHMYKWLMTFKPNKCEFLTRLTSYHLPTTYNPEVTHAKYLGVITDQHLDWNEQGTSKATNVNYNVFNIKIFINVPMVKCNIYGLPYCWASSTVWYLPTHIHQHQQIGSDTKICCKNIL